jgi:uroporphyrinogen-III synthase
MSHSPSALRVLVTRPPAQADYLCQQIEAAGALALRFPLLEIQALTPSVPKINYTLLIFISANAVTHGLPLVRPLLQQKVMCAAVGIKTAHALENAGYPPSLIPPTQFDSEGLLAMPQLHHIAGQQILIVRGAGGREALAQGLRARCAQVDYLEVYRRLCPPTPIPTWLAQGDVDVIILSSASVLDNLMTRLGAYSWLRDKKFIVISPRLAQNAAAQGLRHLYIAQRADDDGVLAALLQLF